MQGDRDIERGLTAEGGKEGIWSLSGDNALNIIRSQWLDICGIRELRVGHDRGWVRIDENHPKAFGPQYSTGLGA